MEIQQQLFKFRYHIAASLFALLFVFAFVHFAPKLLNVLAYFWPLFLSTALFLALVLFFGKTQNTSQHSDAASSSLLKPAEELLHYVAGQHHDPPLDTHFSD